jgi:glycosyltransferase involved in cell wall biosynthesis
MKIALITSYYEEMYGGNEYYLAKYLSELGHQVYIYVSKYSIPRYGKIKKVNSGTSLKNVHVIRLNSVGIKKIGLNYLFGLKNQLKKDKIDVIHVQEWFMPLVFSCLGFKNLILTQRINKYPLILKIYVRILGWFILKKAKEITSLTTESKKELIKYTGISEDNINIIPNGVDIELFRPSKPLFKKDKFTILFVGRLSKEKGINFLIEACKDLKFNYKLIIVGNGPYKKKMLKQIKKNKLQNKIKLIDFIEHKLMPKVYSSADILVMPSIKEPFGFVALESLSCGTPVIASNIGGMKDIITDEIGIKVNPANKKELIKAIINIKNRKYLKKLREKCHNYIIKKYSWKVIIKKYLELY